MNQKAGAATVNADHAQAQRQAETDKALYDLGVISGTRLQGLQRVKPTNSPPGTIWKRRGSLQIKRRSSRRWRSSKPKVDQMRVLAQLKQKQLDALKVRAGIKGVLVDLPLTSRTTRLAWNHAGESGGAGPSDGHR